MDTLAIVPTIQLDSDGTAWIRGICWGEHKGTWMADDSLLWIDEGIPTTSHTGIRIGCLNNEAMDKVTALLGMPLRWKVRTDTVSLVLSDAKADTVLAVFDPFHATGGLLRPAKDVLGTWYLSELPATGAVMDTIPLVLSEDGKASGSDGCNYWTGKWSTTSDSTFKVAFGTTTLIACLDSAGTMIDKGYTKPLAGEVVWSVERLVGVFGDVRRLTLRNPKTGIVVGTYSTIPPKTVLVPVTPPILPIVTPLPYALVGVWGLVSMPIEGLDSATGATLAFDSLGGVSGNIACNAVSGSWTLDAEGKLLVKGFRSTYMLCGDSVQHLVERGMNLMASVPLNWTIDTALTSSGMERVTVSSSLTGATIATFSLARFGVSYPPSARDTTIVVPVLRPVERLCHTASGPCVSQE